MVFINIIINLQPIIFCLPLFKFVYLNFFITRSLLSLIIPVSAPIGTSGTASVNWVAIICWHVVYKTVVSSNIFTFYIKSHSLPGSWARTWPGPRSWPWRWSRGTTAARMRSGARSRLSRAIWCSAASRPIRHNTTCVRATPGVITALRVRHCLAKIN